MKTKPSSSPLRKTRYETPRMSGPYEVRRSIMTGSVHGMTLLDIIVYDEDWD